LGQEDAGKRRQPARNAKSRRARKDDSKETNIAVALLTTDSRQGQRKIV
jgi:hypothetical protein